MKNERFHVSERQAFFPRQILTQNLFPLNHAHLPAVLLRQRGCSAWIAKSTLPNEFELLIIILQISVSDLPPDFTIGKLVGMNIDKTVYCPNGTQGLGKAPCLNPLVCGAHNVGSCDSPRQCISCACTGGLTPPVKDCHDSSVGEMLAKMNVG